MQNKNEAKEKKSPVNKATPKPKHPNTKGAPNNNDPDAQYEDKDAS